MEIPDSEGILTGDKAFNSEPPFSHVVVLPYSSRLCIEAGSLSTELSWPSEIALHAGIIALKQYDGAKLVIVGEDAYEGLDSTTDVTIKRATSAYEVEQNALVPVYRLSNGKPLNNTYRQITGAAQSLVTAKSPNVLVVAYEPHLKRVMQVANGANLLARFVSVEEVLRAANIHSYDDMLPVIAGFKRTERIKRLIGHKKGRLLEILSSLGVVGSTYLDIDETSEDGLMLVQLSAIKRRKQLEHQLIADTLPLHNK